MAEEAAVVTPSGPAPSPDVVMRETMEKTFDAIQEREAEPAPEPAKEPKEPKAAAPERGPDGKFLPKTAKESPTPASAPEKAAAAKVETAPTPAADTAPEHWPAEDQTAFAKMSPEAKQLVLAQSKRLEAGYTRKNQEAADRLKQAEPLTAAVSQFAQVHRTRGVNTAEAVRNALATEHALATGTDEQKRTVLQDLARFYKVDLGQPKAAAPVDAFADPRDKEIADLRGQVSQLTQRLDNDAASRTQAQSDTLQRQAATEVSAFREAKDAAGNSAHPHYEAVQAEIAALLAGGGATTLQEAYEKAVWANPTTRQAVLTAQENERKAKSEAEARERIAKAKKAGGVNVSGNAPRGDPSIKGATMRETAERVYDRING